jgi:hypothetical protein
MKAVCILFAALLVVLADPASAPLFAADLPVGTPSSGPSPASPDAVDAACVAWTDGCRTCKRTGADIVCSNIGIACQPGQDRCTARQSDKKSP